MREAQDGTARRLVVLGPSWTVIRRRSGTASRCCAGRTSSGPSGTSPTRRSGGTSPTSWWRPRFAPPRASAAVMALPVKWIAQAVAVALADPVAWCDWEVGRDPQRIARSVLARLNKNANTREPGRPCVQRWAPWQLTFIELGSTIERPNSLSVGLCLTRQVRHPVRGPVAPREGIRTHRPRLAHRQAPREDAILSISRPFRETDDPASAGGWLRDQLATLEGRGLLPNLDGDGSVRDIAERAPSRGAVASPPVASDCGPGRAM